MEVMKEVIEMYKFRMHKTSHEKYINHVFVMLWFKTHTVSSDYIDQLLSEVV